MLTLILVTPWVAYISSVVLWLGRGARPILFVTTLVCIPAFVRDGDGPPLCRSARPGAAPLRRCQSDRDRLALALAVRTTGDLRGGEFNAGLACGGVLHGRRRLVNRGLGAIGRKAASFNEGDPLWAAIFCTAVLGMIGLGLIGLPSGCC